MSDEETMKYRGFRFDISDKFWQEIDKHVDIYSPVTVIDIHGAYTYSAISLTQNSFDMTDKYISSKRLIWGNLYIFKSYFTFKQEVNRYSKESADKLIDTIGSFNGVNDKNINRFNLYVFYNNFNAQNITKIIYVTGFPMLDCDQDIKVLNTYQLMGKEKAIKIISQLPKNDYKNLIHVYLNERIIPLENLHLVSFQKNSKPVLIFFDTYNDNYDCPSCLLKNIMFNISNCIESKLQIVLICIRELNGNLDKSFVYDIEVDRSFKMLCKPNFGLPTKVKVDMVSNDTDTSDTASISSTLDDSITNVLILGLGTMGCALIDKLVIDMDMNINYTIVDNSTVSLDDLGSNTTYSHNDIGRYKTDVVREYIEFTVDSLNTKKDNTRHLNVNTHRITIPTVGSFSNRNLNDMAHLEDIKNLIKAADVVFCNINDRRTMWIVNLLAKMNDRVCITSNISANYEVIYQGTLEDENVGFDLGCSFCENESFEYTTSNMPQLPIEKYANQMAQHAYNLLVTKKTEETVEYNQIIGNPYNYSEYSLQQNEACMACSVHMQGEILDDDTKLINCLQSETFIISLANTYVPDDDDNDNDNDGFDDL